LLTQKDSKLRRLKTQNKSYWKYNQFEKYKAEDNHVNIFLFLTASPTTVLPLAARNDTGDNGPSNINGELGSLGSGSDSEIFVKLSRLPSTENEPCIVLHTPTST